MNPYQPQFELPQETPAYWHNKSSDLVISAHTLWVAIQHEKSLEVNAGQLTKC